MHERTNRHVVASGCDQGMAQEPDRRPTAGASARSRETSLTTALRILLVALIVAALLPTASAVSAESIESCLSHAPIPTQVTAVHVQPDSGHAPVIDEIDQARCAVDVNMYLFTDQTVLEALRRAEDRGIRVRVILEKQPFGTFGDQQEMYDQLSSLGVEVQWAPDAFQYSHAKYMVVDSTVLLVTNQNFTGAGFGGNREFGVVTTDPRYVNEAQAIFNADWNGDSVSVEIKHLVVSPINARETILGLINGSTESIWMYSEVLRDENITAALSAASERNVDVRILVNASADEEDVPYFLDALGHGVQIRVLDKPYVHAKLLIVDGTQALVGSQNYSFTSLDRNRELGVVIDDPIDLNLIASVYEKDWANAEQVDSITQSPQSAPIALTQRAWVGRISTGRWRVV